MVEQEPKFRSVIIFGPPGAGKGTVGKALSVAGCMYHLSSGDIFRGLSPSTPAGKLFHSYASKGNLCPDDVTIEIWHNYVNGLIATNRYLPEQQFLLLDGIPRTLSQAKMIDEYIQLQHIIVLEMERQEELITRLLRRAHIEGRNDDVKEEVLRRRLAIYENDTAKVLEYYPSEQISRFNADQKPLEVLRDILSALSGVLTCQDRPISSVSL